MADGWTKIGTAALVLLVLEGATGLSAAGLLALDGPRAGDAQTYCSASTSDGFSCSFTNTGASALQGQCAKVVLKPKKQGETVESSALCSGVLGPRETKVVQIPAVGIIKACPGQIGVDFDACTLDVVPVP